MFTSSKSYCNDVESQHVHTHIYIEIDRYVDVIRIHKVCIYIYVYK